MAGAAGCVSPPPFHHSVFSSVSLSRSSKLSRRAHTYVINQEEVSFCSVMSPPVSSGQEESPSLDPYQFRGQVFSPAFSEPPSPSSMSTSSDGGGGAAAPWGGHGDGQQQLGVPRQQQQQQQLQQQQHPFTNRKPLFPTKYHEMLQPLLPVTTLGFESAAASTTRDRLQNDRQDELPLRRGQPSSSSSALQDQFRSLLKQSLQQRGSPNRRLSDLEAFLSQHSQNVDLDSSLEPSGCGDDHHVHQPPVHLCCLLGDLNALRLLVRHGADLTRANRDGFSPLHLASFAGDATLLAFLVEERAAADSS